jgi:hypothetical protein
VGPRGAPHVRRNAVPRRLVTEAARLPRLLLDDAAFDELAERIHLGLLNHTVSLWGQQVTGLPIDFQVQRQTDANEDYPTRAGHWRNPIGIDARTHDTRERHTPGDR